MLLITPSAQAALKSKLGVTISQINQDQELSIIDQICQKKRFRIKVLGGGCSGFQYKFSIDDTISDSDKVLGDRSQLEIVIDQHSLPLIKGATLDHHSSLSGEYFFLKNPNAKSSCGCGNSFSV